MSLSSSARVIAGVEISSTPRMRVSGNRIRRLELPIGLKKFLNEQLREDIASIKDLALQEDIKRLFHLQKACRNLHRSERTVLKYATAKHLTSAGFCKKLLNPKLQGQFVNHLRKMVIPNPANCATLAAIKGKLKLTEEEIQQRARLWTKAKAFLSKYTSHSSASTKAVLPPLPTRKEKTEAWSLMAFHHRKVMRKLNQAHEEGKVTDAAYNRMTSVITFRASLLVKDRKTLSQCQTLGARILRVSRQTAFPTTDAPAQLTPAGESYLKTKVGAY
ncbi:MAG: hypothetical protein V1746_03080 [bacterium]